MHDFVIYGSGISAKIFALAVARSGYTISFISDVKKNSSNKNTDLVTFLSHGSIEYLSSLMSDSKKLYDFEEITNINCELEKNYRNGSQKVNFKSNENNLGRIIKNSTLEELINKEIEIYDNIYLIENRCPLEFINNRENVKILFENGDPLHAKICVVSSTKKNKIFKDLNIDVIEQNLEQTALSIKVKVKRKNKNCAYQRFTPDGPLAFLPYFHNEASIVWSIKDHSKILKLQDYEIRNLIQQKLKDYVEELDFQKIEKHKLNFRYTKKLYDKNFLLIGNIAHNIHPIAGQGLNLSIKDIALFSKTITKYTNIGYNINDQILLSNFNQDRKLDNTAYSFGTFFIDEVFSSKNKVINFLSSQGVSWVQKNKLIKKFIVNNATGKSFFNTL